jgi:hypothetical protein
MPPTPPLPRAGQSQPLLVAGQPLTVARIRNFLRAWDAEPLDRCPFAVFALRHLLSIIDRTPAHLLLPEGTGPASHRTTALVGVTNHLRKLDNPDPPDAFWLKAPRQPGLQTNATQTSGRMPAYACLCQLDGVRLMDLRELPGGGGERSARPPRTEVTSQRACAACNGELDPVVDQAQVEGFLADEAALPLPSNDPGRPSFVQWMKAGEKAAAQEIEGQVFEVGVDPGAPEGDHSECWPFTAGKKSGTMEMPRGPAPEALKPAGLFDQAAPEPADGLF